MHLYFYMKCKKQHSPRKLFMKGHTWTDKEQHCFTSDSCLGHAQHLCHLWTTVEVPRASARESVLGSLRAPQMAGVRNQLHKP